MIKSYIDVPVQIPTSGGFCGADMDNPSMVNHSMVMLAVTTASFSADLEKDKNAGHTILMKLNTKGRVPYVFGEGQSK